MATMSSLLGSGINDESYGASDSGDAKPSSIAVQTIWKVGLLILLLLAGLLYFCNRKRRLADEKGDFIRVR